SWTLRSAEERSEAATAITAAATALFGLPDGIAIECERRPDYEGDPRLPIALVLGAVLLAYAVVADWIVLLASDILVPSRGHPPSATWLQVVVPSAAAVLFVGYAVVAPRVRLAWVARRRPPTAAEVDGVMPALNLVGLMLPPVCMVVGLVLTTG